MATRPIDERAPLLDPEAEAGEPPIPPQEKRTSTSWTTVWHSILVILGVFVVVVFFKGVIDSDDVDLDLGKTLKSALGGGLSGAAAIVLQVPVLMPLRTIMNYQYRYGMTMTQAAKTLYADGGWARYYQGLTAALIQGPMSRFGDTAANVGILALLQSNRYLKDLPAFAKTVFASLTAAGFRTLLTPVDTVKTTMQTDGKAGKAILRSRIKRYGVGTLWYGAVATAAAAFAGHYPWFGMYNYLDETLPAPTTVGEKLLRQAFIGFVASVVSDSVSNSLRVVKTYRQVHETRIRYIAAAEAVIAQDGLRGLLGRGLKTRILANGLQGVMFSVLWKLFLDMWEGKTSKK
ncbi:mitochondrial carrier [Ganoderma leucocontextum]|nr:mitochondrial carrier [Ganoderma leucocontextum]